MEIRNMTTKINYSKLSILEIATTIENGKITESQLTRLKKELKNRIQTAEISEVGRCYRSDCFFVHETAKTEICKRNGDSSGFYKKINNRTKIKRIDEKLQRKPQFGGDKQDRVFRLISSSGKVYRNKKAFNLAAIHHADCSFDFQFNLNYDTEFKIEVKHLRTNERVEFPYSGSYARFPKRTNIYYYSVTLPTKFALKCENYDGIWHIFTEKWQNIDNDISVTKTYWLEGARGNLRIVEGYIARNERVNLLAHGNTEQSAVSALRRKITTLTKSKVTPDTMIDVAKFKRLTGACDVGCETFLKTWQITAKQMSVSEVVQLLRDKQQDVWAERFEKCIMK